MTWYRRRLPAALALTAALVIALAGCGGSDDTTPASSDAASASSDPTATESPTESATGEATDEATDAPSGTPVDPDDFVSGIAAAMDGVDTAHMTIEVGTSTQMEAWVHYQDAGNAMRIEMTTGGDQVEMILVDKTMYMSDPSSDKYLRFGQKSPGMTEALKQFAEIGPKETIGQLDGAVTRVGDLGETEIDGQKLREYAVTVRTDKVAKQLSGVPGTDDLPKQLTYSLFVDGKGRMARTEMEAVGQSLVIRFDDWGQPVSIKAPPASKISK